MRKPRLLILGIVVCAAALEAQLSGPVAGFVFDQASRGLRPILGVPGAAYQGDVVLAGFELAAVAPSQRLAIGIHEGRLYRIDGLDTGAPAATDAGVETPGARRIVWNRTSTAAAVRGDNGRLWLWRSEGGAVELAEPPGAMALAVDPAGRHAVAAASGDQAGLYILEPGAEPRLVAMATDPGAVEIAPNGRDLYVAERARNEILVVKDYAAQASVALFASDPRALADVVGLAVWEENLLAASRGSRSLAVYRSGSGELADRIELEFEPSGLELLSGGWYVVNPGAGRGQPIELLETGPELSLRFVPAIPAEGGTQ
jgi:hypothetical protein